MKAFYCNPPRAKKSKYAHRIQKLLRDTVHHESVGKCAAPNTVIEAINSGYRKRRSIFDELEEEFNQEVEAQSVAQSEGDGFSEKGNYSPVSEKPSTATPNPKQIDKYEMFCKKFFNAVLESAELKHCGKLGAWKLRSKGLLEDMTAMKSICRNRKGTNVTGKTLLKILFQEKAMWVQLINVVKRLPKDASKEGIDNKVLCK